MATNTSCPKSVPGFAAALLIACSGSGDFAREGSVLDSSEDPGAAVADGTELRERAELSEAALPSPEELAEDELLVANRELVDDLVQAMSAYTEIDPDQQIREASAADGDGERRAQRVIRMTDEEKSDVLTLVTAAGIEAPRVSFSGHLIFIDGDTELELDALARPEADGSNVDKGKVLGQIVSTGTPPIAPVIYARIAGGSWLFNRPDLEHNVILIPNAAPAFVFDDFVTAVAAVANASSGDCLGGGFMLVMRQATFDALPSAGRATLRTKTVAYEPGACPAGYAACAQFPVMQNVVISAATPGSEAVLRERFVTGRRIGIDSSQITSSSSASRATFVHELLHTLGIAHPKAEGFGSSHDVTKLVVPGTLSGSCASAPCAPGTNYPSIMHQAMDLGRTNSLQPDDIDVISTLYASAGGCGYRAAARVVVAQ